MSSGTVTLSSWYRALEASTISASLYAVDETLRESAAQAAHSAGCSIHADVILAPVAAPSPGNGWINSGISIDQLTRILSALPEAIIDVHLITRKLNVPLDHTTISRMLRNIGSLRVRTITVSDTILHEFERECAELRTSGIGLWLELAPEDQIALVRVHADHLDGALVMLIEPGTSQDANLALLNRVSTIKSDISSYHPHFAIGVDGGVTAEVAHRATAAGATLIISGRALLDLSASHQ